MRHEYVLTKNETISLQGAKTGKELITIQIDRGSPVQKVVTVASAPSSVEKDLVISFIIPRVECGETKLVKLRVSTFGETDWDDERLQRINQLTKEIGG